MNRGKTGVILTVGVANGFADGVAEIVGQLGQRLAAQLVAVAEEQGAPELPGVGVLVLSLFREWLMLRFGGEA